MKEKKNLTTNKINHLYKLIYFVRIIIGAMASASNFLNWNGNFISLHSLCLKKLFIMYDGEWVKNSFITLSEKSGIGVEINEEGGKKYAIPGVPFFE